MKPLPINAIFEGINTSDTKFLWNGTISNLNPSLGSLECGIAVSLRTRMDSKIPNYIL